MARIVISPIGVVNFTDGGGHFWVYMQYAHGLKSLGCDVYWLERWYSVGDARKDEAFLAAFDRRMRQWGMEGRVLLYSQTGKGPAQFRGMSQAAAEALLRSADLLLNF